MPRVKSPTHLIDFWSLKSILKSLEIILISMKSNDFEITYAIFASVGPLDVLSPEKLCLEIKGGGNKRWLCSSQVYHNFRTSRFST